MIICISKISVCKVFKACTESAFFMSNLNWSTAKLVAGSVNPVGSQKQHGNRTFDFFLNEFNSIYDCVFVIQKCNNEFCLIDFTTAHFQEVSIT